MPLLSKDILLGLVPARHSLRSRLLKLAFLPLFVYLPALLVRRLVRMLDGEKATGF